MRAGRARSPYGARADLTAGPPEAAPGSVSGPTDRPRTAAPAPAARGRQGCGGARGLSSRGVCGDAPRALWPLWREKTEDRRAPGAPCGAARPREPSSCRLYGRPVNPAARFGPANPVREMNEDSRERAALSGSQRASLVQSEARS